MSLSCFFGKELRPQDPPFTPVMPPGSTLVITQVCVTSEHPTGPAVTLQVQSHNMPFYVSVATLHPDRNVYHFPLQLLFSKNVSFKLVAANGGTEGGDATSNASAVAKAEGKKKKQVAKEAATASAAAAQRAGPLPSVHITGYYESEELNDAEEDAENSDEEDEEVSDGEFTSGKKKAAKGSSLQKKAKKDHNKKTSGGATKKRGRE